jgi:hypothetical protein
MLSRVALVAVVAALAGSGFVLLAFPSARGSISSRVGQSVLPFPPQVGNPLAGFSSEEYWSTAISQRYRAYAHEPRITLSPPLAFVGKYRGNYESCGCALNQSGGHAWELGLRRALRHKTSESLSVDVGSDLTPRRSSTVTHDAVTLLERSYLAWYRDVSDLSYLVPDQADDSVSGATGPEVVELRRITETPIQVAGGRRLCLMQLDGAHWESGVPWQSPVHDAILLVALIRSLDRDGAGPRAEWLRQGLPPGSGLVVLLVDSRLQFLDILRQDIAVIGIGPGEGTSVGVLRFGNLSDEYPASFPLTLVNGDATSHDLRLLALGSGRSAVGYSTEPGHLLIDWWTPRVAQVGSGDPEVKSQLVELVAARRRVVEANRAIEKASHHGQSTSEQCGQCHERQARACADDQHAHSIATLAKLRRAEDPKCLECHDGVFRRTGYPLSRASVDCGSCHGDVSIPVSSHEKRPSIVSRSLCVGCHTEITSPEFDFRSFRARLGCLRTE